MVITNRKIDHIDIILRKNVEMDRNSTGFERYFLPHIALPEIDFNEIDLSTTFLGKKLDFPILLSSMVGGTDLSETINLNLGKLADANAIPMAVGSQRCAIEDPALASSFAVRSVNKKGLVFANIGAVQLNYGYGITEVQKAIKMLDADALIFHLNCLQEAIQPEGDTNFKGLLKKIGEICKQLEIPVIVKEVGNGISGAVAKKLCNEGVKVIDVAGAGGTSWAAIEGYRRQTSLGEVFRSWGLSTADCVVDVKNHCDVPVIASGGVYTGLDAVKALVLGADLVGVGRSFLQPAIESYDDLKEVFERFVYEMKVAMFCCGARTLEDLRKIKIEKRN